MNRQETFSEFAFRLSTQFKRWLESEKVYTDINRLRELFLMEQFQNCIDADLRMWLLDQKPKTLSEIPLRTLHLGHISSLMLAWCKEGTVSQVLSY